jgi:4'-phosphopantetheinyl transferase
MSFHLGADRLHDIRAALADDTSVVVWMPIRPETWTWKQIVPQLTPSDQMRAMSFRFEKDRIHFAVSRLLLARIVDSVLEPSGVDWRFAAPRPGGKPQLDIFDGRRLFANLSHTNGCVALVVNAKAEVGIDIEARREGLDLPGLSRLTMTAREQMAISQQSQAEALFYRLWVRKEAVLKAVGCGFFCDPRIVDVLDPSRVILPPGTDRSLTLVDLHGPPHPAALCVLARDARVCAISLDAEDCQPVPGTSCGRPC